MTIPSTFRHTLGRLRSELQEDPGNDDAKAKVNSIIQDIINNHPGIGWDLFRSADTGDAVTIDRFITVCDGRGVPLDNVPALDLPSHTPTAFRLPSQSDRHHD